MKRMHTNKHNTPQYAMNRRQGSTVVILALLVALVLAASYGILETMERRAHSSAEQLVSEVVLHIDEKMREVEIATRAAAESAYGIWDDPEALEQFVREFVVRNSFVYGSTVAFEPDVFPERGRCFAPYSWSAADGTVHSRQLGTETDYYEEEWYAETKKTGREYWCEPYFDEGGAKIMMCTFSVPLKDGAGNLRAVLTADVGLDDLEAYIASISPYPDSCIVLRTQKGNTLVNKDQAAAENDNIIIRSTAQIGWSVELIVPFNYLVRGDTGILFFVGIILLITITLVYCINRLMIKLQQRSSEEYLNVIGALSMSFSSIYAVDLLTDQTVTFRDPIGYEDVLTRPGREKIDFHSKVVALIECDCAEEDREEMFRQIEPSSLREHLANQDRYVFRFRKIHSGGYNWHEMHAFAMERNAKGVPVRAVIAFTDVNESVKKEKETQKTLEQALAMAQSANRAKTDFLFSMSHDIRTPLNAILGFTNMARKHIDDKEKIADCLDKTQQSGNLLLALINSVLEVSRIESGHAELDENVANVEYSFTAVESTLKDLAATKDLELTFEVGPIRDRYVYCDLDRCNRIFVNIISNSIKFTNAGGYIRIRCDQVACDRKGYGNYRYTFTDNGIGMSEEFQKHVFDQFTREATSTVSGVQGSGLGMAVCKSFVDLMGGTIECRSKLGEGTTFTVILPFRLQEGDRYIDPYTREEVSAAAVSEPEKKVNYAGKRVLLVDDNELNREIAEEILSEEGLLIDTAEDGSGAVSILREKGPDHYDFILMDIQMPVMNGYEATAAIRAMYPDKHIPIIALSANAFAEDKAASLAAGMDAHVAKPVNIPELFTVLARFV